MKLKNLAPLTWKFSVLGVMMPLKPDYVVTGSALIEVPTTSALMIYAVPSIVSFVRETSIPATRLSATLKLMNLTSPICSKIAPFYPFFQPVKFVK